MTSVVVGLFDTEAQAEQARVQLMQAGFDSSALSMAGGNAGTSASTSTSMSSSTDAGESPHHDGAIMRFFKNIFGADENEDEYGGTYREAFRRGSYGLTVTAASDAELERAETILNDAGAVDIDERSQQWRSEGWTGAAAGLTGTGIGTSTGTGIGSRSDTSIGMGTDAGSTVGTSASTLATSVETLQPGATRKLQEVEEELKVGKRAVARGGVRIFSRVVEVPVEESVRLREEHAEVQRRVVDRPATEADFAAFKEGSIEVRETDEEAVVGKSARVVGEVEVGKRVTERDETISDTVRKTQVDIEELTDTASTTTPGASTLSGVKPGGTTPAASTSSQSSGVVPKLDGSV